MPDIFDEVEAPESGDIFDQAAGDWPAKKAKLTAEMGALRAAAPAGRGLDTAEQLVSGFANLPANLMNLVRGPLAEVGLAPQEPYQAGKPMLPFIEEGAKDVQRFRPRSNLEHVLKGLSESDISLASGLTTPEMVLTAGTGMAGQTAPAVSRALTGTFATQMGAQIPEAVQQAVEVISDPEAPLSQKVKTGADVAALGIMTGMAGGHLLAKAPPIGPVGPLEPPSRIAGAELERGGRRGVPEALMGSEELPIPPLRAEPSVAVASEPSAVITPTLGENILAKPVELPQAPVEQPAAPAAQPEGVQDASRVETPTEVYGDVRPQPEQGPVEVSSEKGGGGIQPPEEEAGQVPLKPEYTSEEAAEGPGIGRLLAERYEWDEGKQAFVAPEKVSESKTASFNTQQEYESALWKLAEEVRLAKNKIDIHSTDYIEKSKAAMRLESQFDKLADEVELAKTKRRYMLAAAREKSAGLPMPRPTDMAAGPLDVAVWQPPKPTDFHPDPKVRRARSEAPIEALPTLAEINSSLNLAKNDLAKKSISSKRRAQLERIVSERNKQIEKGQYVEARLKAPTPPTVEPPPVEGQSQSPFNDDQIIQAGMEFIAEGGMVPGIKKGGDGSGHYVVVPPELPTDKPMAMGPFKSKRSAQAFLDSEVGAEGAKVVEVKAGVLPKPEFRQIPAAPAPEPEPDPFASISDADLKRKLKLAKKTDPDLLNALEEEASRRKLVELQKPGRKVGRGVSAGTRNRNMFKAEFEAIGTPDLLDFVADSFRVMSKTEARKVRGEDWWKENKSLYDAIPEGGLGLPIHHTQAIFGGRNMPDQVANAAFEAGLIREPTADALWDGIKSASEARKGIKKNAEKEAVAAKAQVEEQQDWMKATGKGEIRAHAEELSVGDVLDVDGERVEVTERDPETGELTLKDGRRFGTQRLEDGGSIMVEKWMQAEPTAEAATTTEEDPFAAPVEEPTATEPSPVEEPKPEPKPEAPEDVFSLTGEEPVKPEPKPELVKPEFTEMGLGLEEAPKPKPTAEEVAKPLSAAERREFQDLEAREADLRNYQGPLNQRPEGLNASEHARLSELMLRAGQKSLLATEEIKNTPAQELALAQRELAAIEAKPIRGNSKTAKAQQERASDLYQKIDRLKSDMTEGQGEIVHRTPVVENDQTGNMESKEFRLRKLTPEQTADKWPDVSVRHDALGGYEAWVAESRRVYYEQDGKTVRSREPWYMDAAKATREGALEEAGKYSGRTSKMWKEIGEKGKGQLPKVSEDDIHNWDSPGIQKQWAGKLTEDQRSDMQAAMVQHHQNGASAKRLAEELNAKWGGKELPPLPERPFKVGDMAKDELGHRGEVTAVLPNGKIEVKSPTAGTFIASERELSKLQEKAKVEPSQVFKADKWAAEYEAATHPADKSRAAQNLGHAFDADLRLGDMEDVGKAYVALKHGDATLDQFNKLLNEKQRQLGRPERELQAEDVHQAKKASISPTGPVGPGMGGAIPADTYESLKAQMVAHEEAGTKPPPSLKSKFAKASIDRADAENEAPEWTSATEEKPTKATKKGKGTPPESDLPSFTGTVTSGIPIPQWPERHMSQLDKVTTAHSAKLQASMDEARRAQKDFRKAVPSERKQAAISVWLEAKGDIPTLQGWESAAKGKMFKRAAADAQTLTAKEIDMASKARSAFDTLHARGTALEVLNSHRDAYVPHVWDVQAPGKGTGWGTSTLKQRFKFAKARTFANFFEGDQAGYTPKTLEIGKLLPAYLHEMNKVVADRQFVKDLIGKTAKDGRPLVIPRGNAKTVDTTEWAVVDKAGGRAKSLHESEADAQTAARAIPGAFVEERPKSTAFVAPRNFAAAKDATGAPIDQGDYRTMEGQPALSKWTWVESDPLGGTTMLQSDLSLHPEAYRRLNAMLGQSALRTWAREQVGGMAQIPRTVAHALDVGQSAMKREMFGLLAPFHQVQEGTHAIGHIVNPFFGIPKVDFRNPAMADAAKHGLMLLPDRTSAEVYMEGVGSKSSLISRGIRKAGPVGRAVSDVVDGYQDYLFHQYIPGLKFKTYEAMVGRNLKLYAKELARGEMSPADVKLVSAEQANAAYGHLNYALLDRNPTMQHLIQLAALAPDFLEARVRFAGQGIKGLTGGKGGIEQFKAIAILAAVQAGSALVMSNLLGSKYDPQHPFEVVYKGRRYFLRSVPEDIYAMMKDTRQFLYGRINPLTVKGPVQFITGLNYRGEKVSPLDTLTELLAGYIPITARQIPGLRSLTETSRQSSTTPLEQLAGSLGLRISRYSPISETHKNASAWMDAQKMPRQKGSYPVSKFTQMRYALEDGDMDLAMTHYRELLKTEKALKLYNGFEESLMKPFTGSLDNDQKFAASLSGYDRELYNLAKRRRAEIWIRFIKMRKLLKKQTEPASDAPVPGDA